MNTLSAVANWAFYIAGAAAMVGMAIVVLIWFVDRLLAFFQWNKAIIEYLIHRKAFVAWKRQRNIDSLYPGRNE
jgi:hypothetical protein